MKLTDKELRVLDELTRVWNAFIELKHEHLNDITEFLTNIHNLQHLIAIRVARRVNPEVWSKTE